MMYAFKCGVGSKAVMLDCYNNEIARGESVSITTRIDACNHYYIMNIFQW